MQNLMTGYCGRESFSSTLTLTGSSAGNPINDQPKPFVKSSFTVNLRYKSIVKCNGSQIARQTSVAILVTFHAQKDVTEAATLSYHLSMNSHVNTYD
uniref:Uncharacterized protein n=1 Tax=Arundo donax TaxID=35708 RepID=A0A0A9E0M7_ARUDO